jgi:hypothetical protein
MFVFQFESQLDFYLSSFTFKRASEVIEKEKCARHDKHFFLLKSAEMILEHFSKVNWLS